MFCLISFHAQNTAESENAVLTLRALVLCDKPFLKNYEVRLKFHVENSGYRDGGPMRSKWNSLNNVLQCLI
jgi:hypothetical protein